eukprot:CAMPEP_0117507942 /NCGR_PEP_ID=MMETSP0784-20121206/26686_1 /TAXON_ID=39447 /ORGANISM="" /LENGTH=193 /DNA_ID=CAMNT_0005303467 /DNA_START=89 /DNA_END=668 /DNA_ORIENTATION=+
MNFNRVANKVTATYVMDPYATLMHYKRAFKLLRIMRENKAKVLILGNKNQFSIDWKGRFEGVEFASGMVDKQVIATAPKYYDMIMCLDPVLYARSLRRMTIPVMMCATAREINQYPELLQVTDYLLPSPSSRQDAALRQLVAAELQVERMIAPPWIWPAAELQWVQELQVVDWTENGLAADSARAQARRRERS